MRRQCKHFKIYVIAVIIFSKPIPSPFDDKSSCSTSIDNVHHHIVHPGRARSRVDDVGRKCTSAKTVAPISSEYVCNVLFRLCSKNSNMLCLLSRYHFFSYFKVFLTHMHTHICLSVTTIWLDLARNICAVLHFLFPGRCMLPSPHGFILGSLKYNQNEGKR